MKTYQKIIFYGMMVVAAVIAILFSSRLLWRILLPVMIAFVAYIIYELDHAIEMPHDCEDYGYFK